MDPNAIKMNLKTQFYLCEVDEDTGEMTDIDPQTLLTPISNLIYPSPNNEEMFVNIDGLCGVVPDGSLLVIRSDIEPEDPAAETLSRGPMTASYPQEPTEPYTIDFGTGSRKKKVTIVPKGWGKQSPPGEVAAEDRGVDATTVDGPTQAQLAKVMMVRELIEKVLLPLAPRFEEFGVVLGNIADILATITLKPATAEPTHAEDQAKLQQLIAEGILPPHATI